MQQNRTCICGAEFEPRTFLSKHCNNNKCFNLFFDKAKENATKKRKAKQRKAVTAKGDGKKSNS